MPVINRIADYYDDMTAWRQHLHENPELEYDCVETAAFVTARLEEFGVDEISQGWAKTGVIAVINGKSEGDTIGLRADMDALPMPEETGLPYASKIEGKMHACGHDGHTTMLLGAARYLAETRNFSGRVVLIFQPAEEGGAGAGMMVEEGLMDKYGISQVYGIHNMPNQEVGTIETRAGPLMAAADVFEIEITGKDGHAAQPHLTIDPIIVGTAMVQNLQTIVSRTVDPVDSVVLSVTRFNAGTADNVISDRAKIVGTLRTFKKDVRAKAMERLKTIMEHVAAMYGATARLDYQHGYPATVNDAAKAAFATKAAAEVVGDDHASMDAVPMMAAEDFSYFLQEAPGAYLFIGNGPSAGLHQTTYNFNDEISPIGASFFVRVVETAQPV
ncbi:amidohydrolase [Amylibacter sp. SFDW26]|uniref:M20 aminoacylase family protein n=1 Tax=Amylibacter sp. SFDW26 TaxID=2652722 RepID=UPI001261EA97|nr:M20 aminoacylase family protein [Amylibacter sp. SFDW26]KAB7616340.1 amidohydrolase [Amylibacter sp. SFDW26]